MKKIYIVGLLVILGFIQYSMLNVSANELNTNESPSNECGIDLICKIEDLLLIENDEHHYIITEDLDFFDKSSYYDYQSTIYGDVNGNGVTEILFEELTTGPGWNPIGSLGVPFEGNVTFEGTLRNLYINRPESLYVGFFGNLGENAVITDAKILDAEIDGHLGVGVLAGSNNGYIINASTSGRITGGSNAGGVAGINEKTGVIKNSAAHVNMVEAYIVGGFVGENQGHISDSYATGAVNGITFVGGFVGQSSDGVIERCYATGMVSGMFKVAGFAGNASSTQIIDSIAFNQSITATDTHVAVTRHFDTLGLDGVVETTVYGIQVARFANLDSKDDLNSVNDYTDTSSLVNVYARSDMEINGKGLSQFNYGQEVSTYPNHDFELDPIIVFNPEKKVATNGEHGADLASMEDIEIEPLVNWDFDAVWSFYNEHSNRPTNGAMTNDLGIVSSGAVIYSIEDLVRIKDDLSASYVLGRDLDFDNYRHYEDPYSKEFGDLNGDGAINSLYSELKSSYGWMPIGVTKTLNAEHTSQQVEDPFTGVFDGSGFTLYNLYINRDEHAIKDFGLFGITKNAIVKNLNIEDYEISGSFNFGPLIGKAINTDISNIYTKGEFKTYAQQQPHQVGGIVGVLEDSTITDSNTNVFSSNFESVVLGLGGVVGTSHNSTILHTHSTGDFYYGDMVGGIAGQMYGGLIEKSYSSVNMYYMYGNVGGLVGVAASGALIYDSNASGTLEANVNVGGLVGSLHSSTIDSSFATGNLKANWGNIGGLVGVARGNVKVEGKDDFIPTYPDFDTKEPMFEDGSYIRNSYATGDIIGNAQFAGGFVGQANDTYITHSYATGNVKGYSDVGGFVGIMINFSVIEDSYVVADQDDDKKIVMASGNIVGGFAGTVDEQSHIRNSAVIDNTMEVLSYGKFIGGFVGQNMGTIKQSFVDGAVIRNGYRGIGGFVGSNLMNSLIEECYTTAEVDTEDGGSVGGFAGENMYDAVIRNSYAINVNEVRGYSSVGGFVGTNIGFVSNVYAQNDVNGFTLTGGLVGVNLGFLENSIAYNNRISNEWDSVERIGNSMDGTFSNNFAFEDMVTYEKGQVIENDSDRLEHGLDISFLTEKTLQPLVSWDFDDVWEIASLSDRPVLLHVGTDLYQRSDIEENTDSTIIPFVGANILKTINITSDYGMLRANLVYDVIDYNHQSTIFLNARITGFNGIGALPDLGNVDLDSEEEDIGIGIQSSTSATTEIYYIIVPYEISQDGFPNLDDARNGRFNPSDSVEDVDGFYGNTGGKGYFDSYKISGLESGLKYNLFLVGEAFGSSTAMKYTFTLTGGHEDDTVYYIETVEDLYNMRYIPNGSFVLSNDLDLKNKNDYKDYNNIKYGDINDDGKIEGMYYELNSASGWRPISNDGLFTGEFDGQGHTISNLYVRRMTDSSFFGSLYGDEDTCDPSNPTFNTDDGCIIIKDITFENPKILGMNSVGTVASFASHVYSDNVDVIRTVESDLLSSIQGTYRVGGLYGQIDFSKIVNSDSIGIYVQGETNSGHIVGYSIRDLIIEDVNVDHYYPSEDIHYKYIPSRIWSGNVGGVIGAGYRTRISNAYVNSEVDTFFNTGGGIAGTLDNYSVLENANVNTDLNFGSMQYGGLVGKLRDNSIIRNSHFVGNIGSTDYIGGLVGDARNSFIYDSSFEGDIYGYWVVGGIIANAVNTEIHNTYHIGNIIGRQDTGGFIGVSENVVIENSYVIGDVIGQERTGGMIANAKETAAVPGYGFDDYYIKNSYIIGNVYGTEDTGALVGVAIETTSNVRTVQFDNVATYVKNLYYDTEYAYYNSPYQSYYGNYKGAADTIYTIGQAIVNDEIIDFEGDPSTIGNPIYTNYFSNIQFIDSISEAVFLEVDTINCPEVVLLSESDVCGSAEFNNPLLNANRPALDYTSSNDGFVGDDHTLETAVDLKVLDFNMSESILLDVNAKMTFNEDHLVDVPFFDTELAEVYFTIVPSTTAAPDITELMTGYGAINHTGYDNTIVDYLQVSGLDKDVDYTVYVAVAMDNRIPTTDDIVFKTFNLVQTIDGVDEPYIQYVEDILAIQYDLKRDYQFKPGVVIDFKDHDSYKDSSAISPFGDINENGVVESVYIELTTGKGFRPIGGLPIHTYMNNPNVHHPISSSYQGTISGNGATIRNLLVITEEFRTVEKVDRYDDFGLFAKIEYSTITDLHFDQAYIYGGNNTGILAGSSILSHFEDISVSNSIVESNVDFNTKVGGLVGYAKGGSATNITVNDLYVDGFSEVGGVFGVAQKDGYSWEDEDPFVLENVTINNVEVKGLYNVGGVVGLSKAVQATDIYGNSFVVGQERVGGLFGDFINKSSLTNSGYTGVVHGVYYASSIGGMIGRVYDSGTITNVSVDAHVSGNTYTGGVIGFAIDNVNIENAYFTGVVTGGASHTGGIVGRYTTNDYTDNSYMKNVFSAGIATGKASVGGITGNNHQNVIEYAVSMMDVSGETFVGGIVGVNSGVLRNTITNAESISGLGVIVSRITNSITYEGNASVENNYAPNNVVVVSNNERITYKDEILTDSFGIEGDWGISYNPVNDISEQYEEEIVWDDLWTTNEEGIPVLTETISHTDYQFRDSVIPRGSVTHLNKQYVEDWFVSGFSFYTLEDKAVEFTFNANYFVDEYCFFEVEYNSLDEFDSCYDNYDLGLDTDSFDSPDGQATLLGEIIVEANGDMYFEDTRTSAYFRLNTSLFSSEDHEKRFIITGEISGDEFIINDRGTAYLWSDGQGVNAVSEAEFPEGNSYLVYTYHQDGETLFSNIIHYEIFNTFISPYTYYEQKVEKVEWSNNYIIIEGYHFFKDFNDVGNINYNILLKDKETNQVILRQQMEKVTRNDIYDWDEILYEEAGFKTKINAYTLDLHNGEYELFIEMNGSSFRIERQLSFSQDLEEKIMNVGTPDNLKLFDVQTKNNELTIEISDVPEDTFGPRILSSRNQNGDIDTILLEVGSSLPDLEEGIIAIDLHEGDVTDTLSANLEGVDLTRVGTYYMYYNANDSIGNTTSKKVKVIIFDNTAPVITAADIETYVGEEIDYTIGVSVRDNSGEEIALSVDASAVDINTPGVYEVIFSATDSEGNKTNKTITVTVLDTTEEQPETDVVSDNNDESKVNYATWISFSLSGVIIIGFVFIRRLIK